MSDHVFLNYICCRVTKKSNRLDLVGVLLACPVFVFLCLVLTQSSTQPLESDTTSFINDTTLRHHTRGSLKLHSRHISPQLLSGTRTCLGLKRPPESKAVIIVKDYWQYERSADSNVQILLYSAYYDDRPLLQTETWIRVLGIASLKPEDRVLHCHVWYNESEAPYVTQAVVNSTGRESGYQFPKVSFIQLLFSCPLPNAIPYPTHVSIVASPCARATTYIPVKRLERTGFLHEFGICVPISFGRIQPAAFVEWMEMYQLLGVGEFHIYDSSMVNMTNIFDYYISRGVLTVHKIPPPVGSDQLNGVKVASAVSLNDCMMSNMYRYQFIVIVDFDEFILPRMHDTYTQMLDHIDKKKKKTERQEIYSFKNLFYFKNAPLDLSKPEYLQIARYRSRPRSLNPMAFPKSFIDPRSCLSVWNHYCLRELQGPLSSIDVDAPIAVVQHYRKCGLSEELCTELLNNSTRDDTALRFMAKLQPRVEEVLRKLRELET